MSLTLAEMEAELLSLKSSFSSANLELTRRKADLDDDVIRDANSRAGMKSPTGYTGDPRNATIDTVGTSLVVNAPPGAGYMDKGVTPFDFWKRRGYAAASWEKMSFAGVVADAIGGGTVYIYDVTATQAGKNVGAKTYQDGQNTIVQSSTSDTTEVTVHVRATYPQIKVYDPRDNTIKPGIYTLRPAKAGDNFFEGQIPVALPGAGGLVKVTVMLGDDEDGSSDSTVVVVEQAPTIQSAIFTGGYPVGLNNGGLTQTELKANDSFGLEITADQDIHRVQFENLDALKAAVLTPLLPGVTVDVTGMVADRGNVAQALGARVRVANANGSWSKWFNTESGGSTDGMHVVILNNVHPRATISNIAYPAGTPLMKSLGFATKEALDNGDTAIITVDYADTDGYTVTSPQFHFNFDVASGTSPAAQMTLQATAQAAVIYLAGTNVNVAVVRNANDSLGSTGNLVKLQGIVPTASVVGAPARYVSGGNDGTAVQIHTVQVAASSNLLSFGMENDGASTSALGNASGGPINWLSQLTVADKDPKGSFEWANILGINLAGLELTNLADASYVIGGFVSRDLPITGFTNITSMNVAVVSPAKVVGKFNSADEDLVMFADLVGVVVHDSNRKVLPEYQHGSGGTTFDALATNPTEIRWLDQLQADANTTGETLTIEETA
jgi:hypothetical protein